MTDMQEDLSSALKLVVCAIIKWAQDSVKYDTISSDIVEGGYPYRTLCLVAKEDQYGYKKYDQIACSGMTIPSSVIHLVKGNRMTIKFDEWDIIIFERFHSGTSNTRHYVEKE